MNHERTLYEYYIFTKSWTNFCLHHNYAEAQCIRILVSLFGCIYPQPSFITRYTTSRVFHARLRALNINSRGPGERELFRTEEKEEGEGERILTRCYLNVASFSGLLAECFNSNTMLVTIRWNTLEQLWYVRKLGWALCQISMYKSVQIQRHFEIQSFDV